MKISSPRKGTEQIPRIFSSWQEQVIRAIRAIGWSQASVLTVQIDFGSVAAHGQVVSAPAVIGARIGDVVTVSPNAAIAGIIFDGYVTADDVVNVRANNYTAGAIDPPSTSFSIVATRP